MRSFLWNGRLPYLFVGIDRTGKFAVTQLVDKADRKTAWEFLQYMLEAVPYHHRIIDRQCAADRDPGQKAQDQKRGEIRSKGRGKAKDRIHGNSDQEDPPSPESVGQPADDPRPAPPAHS